jgi:2-dehydro-3-deoxyphosphogluconate aldolase/(4S)-4-hydroxy-2-oxoglutarate aldolase
MSAVEGTLARLGVIPVLTLERSEAAVPIARALAEGDLPVVEITFRTPAAAEGVERLVHDLPSVLVGAGTILTLAQARQAIDAGARFLVSPGFDPELVRWCRERGVDMIPGAVTPTEILAALREGVEVLKFFPAQALGGPRMLKALAGPFAGVRFVPTGGIGPEDLGSYLRLPNVLAVGGSWMVAPDLVASQDFPTIARLAREASLAVAQLRGTSG